MWYASFGDAGRHWSATRRTTFCRRLSASRPCAPPTSSALPATGSASSPLSDAGIEIASSTPGVPLTASVSDCANVNWSSNVPPARSSRATRLRA